MMQSPAYFDKTSCLHHPCTCFPSCKDITKKQSFFLFITFVRFFEKSIILIFIQFTSSCLIHALHLTNMQRLTSNRNVESGGTMNLDLNGHFSIHLSSNRQIQLQLHKNNNVHCIVIIISLIVSKIITLNGNGWYYFLFTQPVPHGSKQSESKIKILAHYFNNSICNIILGFIDKMNGNAFQI